VYELIEGVAARSKREADWFETDHDFDAARMAGCELVPATDEQLDGALDAFLA
jgi:hypothetical protein